MPLARDMSVSVLTQLNNCLTLCDKFDFVDLLPVPLAVTNLFHQYLSSNMNDHKTVSWQVIAVAFKLKVFAPFIQGAQDLNGELPGPKIEPNWGPPSKPSDDTDNVRNKLMHAFWHACPSFDRALIIKIIENPELLSQKSFIETIKESSG